MGSFFTRNYNIFFGICMGAIVGLSFYVGMLEGKQAGGEHVTLSCSDKVLSALAIPTESLAGRTVDASSTPPVQTGTATSPQGAFAGSKNGTKYYTPGCAGLDRIKPENLIWFQSAEDATLQGYSAAQC